MGNVEVISGVPLSAAEKSRARRAAEHFVAAAKHWVPAAEETEKLRGEMTGQLLGLAQYAWHTHRRNAARAEELYKALTAESELHIKTTMKVSNLKKELNSWAPIKSVILRGMRMGLPPVDYDSYTAFRDATLKQVEVRSKRKALPRTIQKLEIDGIEERFDDTGIHNILRTDIARVIAVAEHIAEGKEREAQALTREYLERMAQLMDPNK